MPMKLVKPKSPCNGQVGRDIPDGLKGSLSFNKIDLNLLKVVSRLLKSRPKVIPQLFQSRLKTVQKLSQSCLKVVLMLVLITLQGQFAATSCTDGS